MCVQTKTQILFRLIKSKMAYSATNYQTVSKMSGAADSVYREITMIEGDGGSRVPVAPQVVGVSQENLATAFAEVLERISDDFDQFDIVWICDGVKRLYRNRTWTQVKWSKNVKSRGAYVHTLEQD
jgi:hypothetical protein